MSCKGMVSDAIEKKIIGEWKHEGGILSASSEHVDFEIDGKEYVIAIKELEKVPLCKKG